MAQNLSPEVLNKEANASIDLSSVSDIETLNQFINQLASSENLELKLPSNSSIQFDVDPLLRLKINMQLLEEALGRLQFLNREVCYLLKIK